jgi:hypothetical protein
LKVLSFKHRASRRSLLEAIQHERGHSDLSVTLREAVDTYIAANLGKPQAPTERAA